MYDNKNFINYIKFKCKIVIKSSESFIKKFFFPMPFYRTTFMFYSSRDLNSLSRST